VTAAARSVAGTRVDAVDADFIYVAIQANAVVTCEIELFQNDLSLRRRPSEIIMLFQPVESCLKLIQNYFTGLLQLTNIFQHVHCR